MIIIYLQRIAIAGMLLMMGGCSTSKDYSDTDYELRKVRDILLNSKHEDKVHIIGKIIGQIKVGTFNFKDENGRIIQIRIDEDEIPKKGLLFHSPAAIHGEVIKVPERGIYLDAEKVHYNF